MTDKIVYMVRKPNVSRWDERYETLAEAETEARKQAFTGGEDAGIYKLVAVAEKPQIVNDVKITAVQ